MARSSAPLVKVEGLPRLRKTLRQAGSDLTELKAVHERVGRIALAGGKRNVPYRTGLLASTLRSSGTKTAATLRAGFARVPYAQPIHWGWPTRPNRAKRWRGGPIAANPFLSEGATDTEPSWLAEYERALDQILDTIKGA